MSLKIKGGICMFIDMTVMEIINMLLPLIILQLILAVVGLTSLVRSNEVRFLPKWAWAVIIIFVQIFGPTSYFIFGREKEV